MRNIRAQLVPGRYLTLSYLGSGTLKPRFLRSLTTQFLSFPSEKKEDEKTRFVSTTKEESRLPISRKKQPLAARRRLAFISSAIIFLFERTSYAFVFICFSLIFKFVVFSCCFRARVKSGLRLLGATSSNDQWTITVELKSKVATVTAVRKEPQDQQPLPK